MSAFSSIVAGLGNATLEAYHGETVSFNPGDGGAAYDVVVRSKTRMHVRQENDRGETKTVRGRRYVVSKRQFESGDPRLDGNAYFVEEEGNFHLSDEGTDETDSNWSLSTTWKARVEQSPGLRRMETNRGRAAGFKKGG